MYYHYRPLRHVAYGKVYPPPVETLDPDTARAYRWLGQYCKFFPQVWLSRSHSSITGFRSLGLNERTRADGVLFGFESIRGFPLDYDFWCELMIDFINAKSLDEANKAVEAHLDWRASDPDLCEEPVSLTWRETRDVRAVLCKHLFVKHDQVVVPNLNLKAAKLVICRNEYQKKVLRRMGFIEDRLVIRVPRAQW
jgi:hypothetical protein